MTGFLRYLRLLGAFARFSLANELAFRVNFLMKVLVELLWLGILLIFYDIIFGKTREVGGWDENRYLFFVGCYYLLEGTIETFFLSNCTEFSDLVRSGDLDIYLLRPIDEQFLITCRLLDWSTVPKLLIGPGVMGVALWRLAHAPASGEPWHFDLGQAAAFVVLFGCSVAIAYSFLLLLTMSAVWLVRNQSLMEMWWLLTTLMRYPREIYYRSWWAAPIYYGAWWLLPVLVIINVPASVMVRSLQWHNALFAVVAAIGMLAFSRWFFLKSLQSYRSASS